ncbi:RNA pseudouridylate synthase domain-containing protein 2 [Arapaima gigas]
MTQKSCDRTMPWIRSLYAFDALGCRGGRLRHCGRLRAKHSLLAQVRLYLANNRYSWKIFSENRGSVLKKVCLVGSAATLDPSAQSGARWRLRAGFAPACFAERLGVCCAASDTGTQRGTPGAMDPPGGQSEKRKSSEVEESEQGGQEGKRRRGAKNLRSGERYVPPPKKRNPGVSFNEEHFRETSYYFEGGLRKVHPYYFDFRTYCKGRWVGKTLLEVFSTEFRAESLNYYRQAARAGRIRLNETPVEQLDITLKNNDFLRNTVHRHEPPVSARPLEILEDNEEVLVVDKPASLPVHPCGRFRHNTVIFILGKERGVSGLHTVHRLDRLTSGVLLFARTLEVSKKLDQLVRDRQIEKEYVCRVAGEFPEGELVCEEPILVVSFKVGVCRVDPKGKPCRTVFQRLSWNGHSSVVRCLPLTGRTHQIRVHLQFLGHPILNDPIYGSAAWGPHRGKGGQVGMSDEELLKALVEEHQAKQTLHLLDIPDESLPKGKDIDHEMGGGCSTATSVSADYGSAHSAQSHKITIKEQGAQACGSDSSKVNSDDNAVGDASSKTVTNSASQSVCNSNGNCGVIEDSLHTAPVSSCPDNVAEEGVGDLLKGGMNCGSVAPSQSPSDTSPAFHVKDPLCSECRTVRPDPTEKDLIMYLHALRYKGPDFEYSTRVPDWARDDWEEE